MNTLFALIRREYWENRNVFLMIPLVLSVIMVFCAVDLALLGLFTHHVSFFFHFKSAHPNIGHFVSYLFFVVSFPFAIMLWLVLFNYFLRAFYTERKDGSILFWQSMPVSQCKTVLSKWIVGLLVAPLISAGVAIVTGLIMLVLASFLVSSLAHVPPGALWSFSRLAMSAVALIAAFVMQGVWLLPLLAWCLFCSATSVRAPFLKAIFVPFLLVLVELFLDTHYYVAYFIGHCFKKAIDAWGLFYAWLGGGAHIHLNGQAAATVVPHLHWAASANVMPMSVFILCSVLIAFVFSVISGLMRSRFYGCDC